MVVVLQEAKKDGWAARTPIEANKRVWAALAKVAKRMDILAPEGQLSADDALQLAAVRRIPGMLVDLKGQKGLPSKVPDLPEDALAEIARTQIKTLTAALPPVPTLPVIDPDKVPRPQIPGVPRFKLGGLSLFLILALIAVKAKKRK